MGAGMSTGIGAAIAHWVGWGRQEELEEQLRKSREAQEKSDAAYAEYQRAMDRLMADNADLARKNATLENAAKQVYMVHPSTTSHAPGLNAALEQRIADMEREISLLSQADDQAGAKEKKMQQEQVVIDYAAEQYASQQEYPRPEWLKRSNDSVNIAVIGASGTGKSALVNALRGLLPKNRKDKDFAAVGTTECTRYPPVAYSFPKGHPFNGKAVLWDMPGAGTQNVPASSYIQRSGLRHYDCVLVATAERLNEVTLSIVKELDAFKVPYFIVRNKIDLVHVKAEDYDEDVRVLRAEAKQDIVQQCGTSAERVFLVAAEKNGSWNENKELKLLKAAIVLAMPKLIPLDMLTIKEASEASSARCQAQEQQNQPDNPFDLSAIKDGATAEEVRCSLQEQDHQSDNPLDLSAIKVELFHNQGSEAEEIRRSFQERSSFQEQNHELDDLGSGISDDFDDCVVVD